MRLPKRCLVVLPGMPAGRNVAVCVRGESGVRLTPLDFGADVAAARVVREVNRALGIAPSQERAMLVGCLVGWGGSVPGCAESCGARGAVLH